MADELIKCPACGNEFPITQAISESLERSIGEKFKLEIQQMRALREKTEKELKEKFEDEKKELVEKADKTARESLAAELCCLREELKEKDSKIARSRELELKLRKDKREIEEARESLELDLNRKLDEERSKIIENTKNKIAEEYKLKDGEKDKKLSDLNEQITILRRKIEQGSQQSQGEILELEIEDLLRSEFPADEILPVGKGVRGADVVQIVKRPSGGVCGSIIWEMKRTRNWNDEWLQKLKDDRQEAKADIPVLVSETLPPGITHFRMMEGVWVSSIPSALSLGAVLRAMVITAFGERQLQTGKEEKMEVMYNYLTGLEFKNRVEAIVKSFVQMKSDMDAEKRAMQKIWSKREKQIERIIHNIGGMHGDLEGLAGASIPGIKALELPADGDGAEPE